jgi:hypothetical protein
MAKDVAAALVGGLGSPSVVERWGRIEVWVTGMSKGCVDGLVVIVNPSKVFRDDTMGDSVKAEGGGGAFVVTVRIIKGAIWPKDPAARIVCVIEREGDVMAVSEVCECCGNAFDVIPRTSSELVWSFRGPTRLGMLENVAASAASGITEKENVDFAPSHGKVKSAIRIKRNFIIRRIRVPQIR